MVDYQGIYTDSSGKDPAVVHFDAATIGFTVRGVEFTGGPDGYRATLPSGSPELSAFTFVTNQVGTGGGESRYDEMLMGFALSWEMPMTVAERGRLYPGELRVIYHLLDPGGCRAGENGEISYPKFSNLIDLTLFYSYQKYTVASGGTFQEVLGYLIAAIGYDAHIQACAGCAHSGYPLQGHGCYGPMLCFRNLKEEYRRLRSGPEPDGERYLALSNDERVLIVGELYCCSEFAPKAPLSSYRA